MLKDHTRGMEPKDAVRSVKDGTEIEIIVSPNSNRQGIEGLDEWRKRIIVRVRAPPLDGKANREVEDVIGEITGLKCSIIRGQTSRQKTVLAYGPEEKVLQSISNSLKQ